jgi:hypothetical protein
MDPLSITTGCLALIGAISKTSIFITHFIRGCREARGDLTSVSHELFDLQFVLDFLKEDSAVVDDDVLPGFIRAQILSVIGNCGEVIDKIEKVLNDISESRVPAARWMVDGKKEVATLKSSLETHRRALNLALEIPRQSIL